jgi:uncharacterized protein HemX
MARNRKYQSAAIRFGPAIKAFLLCVVVGGSGVGYVWQKSQIDLLGQQIRKREQLLAGLQDQNEMLKRQLSFMSSMNYLEAQIKKLDLNLGPPPTSQIWLLKLPPPDTSSPERGRQYAAQPVEAAAMP